MLPIIHPAVQTMHMHPLLDELNARQKACSLDPVFKQVIRVSVTRSDKDNSTEEQFMKESSKDHSVGNISDLELVKAEEPIFAEGIGNEGSRVEV